MRAVDARWDSSKAYPSFDEIDQPDAILLRIEIVINGDESSEVGASFLYEGQTRKRNQALLDLAVELLTEHAENDRKGR